MLYPPVVTTAFMLRLTDVQVCELNQINMGGGNILMMSWAGALV